MGRCDRGAQLARVTLAPECQLELGAHGRQWRAQLMARVAHQPPFAGKAGLEPVEHLVQSAAEGADLVAGLR